MNSILQNTAPTISESWYEDGEIVDPGVVTIAVVRDDGTQLVPSGTDTDGSGEAARTYDLALSDTALLGTLTAIWTSPTKGSLTTPIRIVGGFYFTIAEFKARYPDMASRSADEIAQARATAEDIIEGIDAEEGTHVAFVPREESFDLIGSSRLPIPRYQVRTVESISIDGQHQDLTGVVIDGSALCGVRRPHVRLVVTVTHGHDFPPGRIKDAAMILAHSHLNVGPLDDRATGRLTPDGSVITLAVPGMRGAVTGIPEVDAAILQYRKRRIRPTAIWAGDPSVSYSSDWRDGVWP